ncbi:unnamed protein product [Cylicocyclus nassatus]|uniref:Uncharacterized protein n=1 Tax=Cylicocyclus nassatus TaxID=53992 RepID=A0AA36DV10_CYLNA|nr:unnamed protein product [Cylicocyclus nassatus]
MDTSSRTKESNDLLYYCSKGDIHGVDEESRKDGVDPNVRDADGNTPLILATEAGHTIIVEMLLSRFPQIRIDQVNHLGQSALMKAAIQGRVTCARALLRAGADPTLRDFSRGFCALEWAEYVGRTECMQIIAHYMLKPGKREKATFTAMIGDLQKMTAAATIPVLGETVDTLVPLPRPRLGSAPIPRLEITVAPDLGPRNNSYSCHRKRRPKSAMA